MEFPQSNSKSMNSPDDLFQSNEMNSQRELFLSVAFPQSNSNSMNSPDDLFQSNEEELFPISDEKYAGELYLQEVLMSSFPSNLQHQPHNSHEISVGSSKNPIQNQNPSESEAGESSESYCGICMEAKPTHEMFKNKSCPHAFCTDCISKHVAAKIQENISVVRCPGLNCKGVVEPYQCRHIVPAPVFERWENALCESTVLGLQRVYCPYKECSALLIDDGGNVRESECPNCHRLFCARCKVPWHSGIQCEDYMKLGMDERGRDDLMVMELAKSKQWKRCPRCKFYVEKALGCLHITCRCGFDFCYGCGVKWSVMHDLCTFRMRRRS